MATFLGCSNILWTGHVLEGKGLSARLQSMLPGIRARLSGITPSKSDRILVLRRLIFHSNFNMGKPYRCWA